MPSNSALDRATRLFRALGDVSRLRLLSRLAQGEMCVSDIARAENDDVSTISQRLRLLRIENIVSHRRDGKHIHYALADRHIAELIQNVLEHVNEPSREGPRTLQARKSK